MPCRARRKMMLSVAVWRKKSAGDAVLEREPKLPSKTEEKLPVRGKKRKTEITEQGRKM